MIIFHSTNKYDSTFYSLNENNAIDENCKIESCCDAQANQD